MAVFDTFWTKSQSRISTTSVFTNLPEIGIIVHQRHILVFTGSILTLRYVVFAENQRVQLIINFSVADLGPLALVASGGHYYVHGA